MKKTLVKYGSVTAMALLPVSAMAQAGIDDSYLLRIINLVQTYLNVFAALIIALAFLYFLWGLLSFVTSGGDSEKRTKAINTIIMGIVILAVMVSVWGLVKILTNFFGVDSTSATIPTPPVITLPN